MLCLGRASEDDAPAADLQPGPAKVMPMWMMTARIAGLVLGSRASKAGPAEMAAT